LVSIFPASKKFDYDLELDAGMHKTDAHPCPPMNDNIAPMSTQNPWMGMGMGMGTQCRALLHTRAKSCDHEIVRAQKKNSVQRPSSQQASKIM